MVFHSTHRGHQGYAMLFAEENEREQRARMKIITNAWDMDAGEEFWAKKYGNPHKRTLKRQEMTLDGGGKFRLDEYRAEIGGATAWMARHAPTAGHLGRSVV